MNKTDFDYMFKYSLNDSNYFDDADNYLLNEEIKYNNDFYIWSQSLVNDSNEYLTNENKVFNDWDNYLLFNTQKDIDNIIEWNENILLINLENYIKRLLN